MHCRAIKLEMRQAAVKLLHQWECADRRVLFAVNQIFGFLDEFAGCLAVILVDLALDFADLVSNKDTKVLRRHVGVVRRDFRTLETDYFRKETQFRFGTGDRVRASERGFQLRDGDADASRFRCHGDLDNNVASFFGVQIPNIDLKTPVVLFARAGEVNFVKNGGTVLRKEVQNGVLSDKGQNSVHGLVKLRFDVFIFHYVIVVSPVGGNFQDFGEQIAVVPVSNFKAKD